MPLPMNSVFAIAPGCDELVRTVLWATVMRSAGRERAQGETDTAKRSGLPVRRDGYVAVVDVKGLMLKDMEYNGYWGVASMQAVMASLASAAVDDDIGAIVLDIDSPGGSVDGMADLSDAIVAASKSKPVIAQVSGMAASAAYYAAASASKILAGRMDAVGSIGVRMMVYDFSELFSKEGIKAIPIDTGEYKSAGAMGTEVTENQKQDFQRVVDLYFGEFLRVVSQGRKARMTPEQVRAVADGRIFLSSEAASLGLIDGVSTLQETVAQVAAGNVPPSRMGKYRAALAARKTPV